MRIQALLSKGHKRVLLSFLALLDGLLIGWLWDTGAIHLSQLGLNSLAKVAMILSGSLLFLATYSVLLLLERNTLRSDMLAQYPDYFKEKNKERYFNEYADKIDRDKNTKP